MQGLVQCFGELDVHVGGDVGECVVFPQTICFQIRVMNALDVSLYNTIVGELREYASGDEVQVDPIQTRRYRILDMDKKDAQMHRDRQTDRIERGRQQIHNLRQEGFDICVTNEPECKPAPLFHYTTVVDTHVLNASITVCTVKGSKLYLYLYSCGFLDLLYSRAPTNDDSPAKSRVISITQLTPSKHAAETCEACGEENTFGRAMMCKAEFRNGPFFCAECYRIYDLLIKYTQPNTPIVRDPTYTGECKVATCPCHLPTEDSVNTTRRVQHIPAFGPATLGGTPMCHDITCTAAHHSRTDESLYRCNPAYAWDLSPNEWKRQC